jgi:hypothetical protein
MLAFWTGERFLLVQKRVVVATEPQNMGLRCPHMTALFAPRPTAQLEYAATSHTAQLRHVCFLSDMSGAEA